MRDLQRINRELGMTIIVNLHFLDLARVYGERIIGLRDGELVFDGTGERGGRARLPRHLRPLADRGRRARGVGGLMTAAAPTASARPRPPRRSLAVPIGLVAFLAITWWAASKEFGIDFNVGEIIGGFSRGAGTLAEFWPPELPFFPETLRPMLETFQMAVIASAIGCSLALPIAFLASRVTTPNFDHLHRGSRRDERHPIAARRPLRADLRPGARYSGRCRASWPSRSSTSAWW